LNKNQLNTYKVKDVLFVQKVSWKEKLEIFEKIKDRDIKKYNLCKNYGINILYYSKYTTNEKYIDLIYKLDDLIKKIKENELK